MPLLEASFRLFRWKDEDAAAAALQVSPDQVRMWRRGAELMSVVDYLSLMTMVNLGIAQAARSESTDLDLPGATESLGLNMTTSEVGGRT